MITIEQISQAYGETSVLTDVSLSVNQGEIFTLIGPNGSGKTTLLSLLAGLLPIQKGSITIDDNNLKSTPEAAKRVTAFIPDQPAIWPGMTGFEFLHFTGSLYNVPEATRKKRIPELLDLFTLDGTEHERFETYSRGNKQKFSFMAAFLIEPKVMLIDEPIVGLDPISIEILLQELATFTNNGGTVFIVSHTLDVAERMSDRFAFLHHGKIQGQGSLEELRSTIDHPSASLYQIYTELLKS